MDGGPSVTIARTSARPAGAAWRPDGIIVFGTTEGLCQVSQDGGDVRLLISIDGGRFPLWGPPGTTELYYVSLTGDMMAASVKLAPALGLGPVTKLFDFQKPPAGRSGMPYDVAADGRFLTTQSVAAGSPAPTQVSIVLNWANALREQMARR